MRTSNSRHAFPFDATMPELPAALDPAVAGPLLGRYLGAAGVRDDTATVCRVTRIRYRPQERCVVQYELTSEGTTRLSPVRTLITGTLFADPRRAARRAARSETHYLPELRMECCLFPADPKLPQAQALVDAVDPRLQRVLLRASGSESWQLQRCDREVVRYREGLSLVVRYALLARHIQTDESRTRVVYAKAYPQADEARRACAHLTHLSDLVARDGAELRVDPPLASDSELAIVVLPAAEGRSLLDCLETDHVDNAILETRRSALAVATLHACDAQALRAYELSDFIRSLQRPLRILSWALPALNLQLQEIVRRVAHLTPGELAPTHRDMKPEHVFLGNDRVTLIDLDSCSASDPVLDVALMLARFEALAQEQDRPQTVRLAAEFEAAYFQVAPESRRARLPLLFAASLVEVAAGLFHRQLPGWRERIAALIDRAHGHAVRA